MIPSHESAVDSVHPNSAMVACSDLWKSEINKMTHGTAQNKQEKLCHKQGVTKKSVFQILLADIYILIRIVSFLVNYSWHSYAMKNLSTSNPIQFFSS